MEGVNIENRPMTPILVNFWSTLAPKIELDGEGASTYSQVVFCHRHGQSCGCSVPPPNAFHRVN